MHYLLFKDQMHLYLVQNSTQSFNCAHKMGACVLRAGAEVCCGCDSCVSLLCDLKNI